MIDRSGGIDWACDFPKLVDDVWGISSGQRSRVRHGVRRWDVVERLLTGVGGKGTRYVQT